MTDLLVTLDQGKVRGKHATNYHGSSFISFLGIPYAKSPIGPLRFRAPQPPEPWEGIRDCSKEGNECPSLHFFFDYHVGSEDECLNLNVHCKYVCSGRKTPVMVWIHGGAFNYGSNRGEMYGVEYLMTQDIVLVAINYRLGVLGFLSLEDPLANVPGNNGLKDMVMSLKWINQNIHKFGGDPGNVTIFGESAGSAAVHYLTLSEMTQGLFHKAILQSGCVLNAWALGKSNGHIIAKLLGYNENDDDHIVLEKLRKESVKTLISAQFKIKDDLTPKDIRPWVPVVEKSCKEPAFLTKPPLEIIQEGSFHKVPMIIGYASQEGMLYEAFRRKGNLKLPSDFEKEVPHMINAELGGTKSKQLGNRVKEFYFNGEDVNENNVEKLYTLRSDNCFIYGLVKTIQYQSKISREPIYSYRMTLESSLNYFKRLCTVKHVTPLFIFYFLIKNNVFSLKKLYYYCANILSYIHLSGVCHGDDLGYFFKTFFSPPIEKNSREDLYIQRFLKLWTNFAKYGTPTPKSDVLFNGVNWTPVLSDNVKVLDLGEKLDIITNPDMHRVRFWDAIFEEEYAPGLQG